MKNRSCSVCGEDVQDGKSVKEARAIAGDMAYLKMTEDK